MSVSKNFSWRERLQYKFDNFMSKGGLAVFLALLSAFFIAFILMLVIRYGAEFIFPNYSSEYYDLPWEVLIQLIGLRSTEEDANSIVKVVTVITIFIGLIFFSSLVAFITEEFESKLASLRKGKSIVVETGHTLILGFNERIIDIIKELIIANESEDDAAIVILSDKDKEEMDDFLRDNLEQTKTTRLVTRTGGISNISNLKNAGLKSAKTVIILNEAKSLDDEEFKIASDSKIIKSLLAIVATKGQKKEDTIPDVVVEIHSLQYRQLAEAIAPNSVTTLNESDILAKILVQTSRNNGLSAVYLNLVGFEGNEFYFYRPDDGWNNLNFGQLPFHFSGSVPLGVRDSAGKLTLNPDINYQLKNDDEIVILAEDDSTINFVTKPVFTSSNKNFPQEAQTKFVRPQENHLIIGWNNKTPLALREYAFYLTERSQLTLMVNQINEQIQEEFTEITNSYPQIDFQLLEIDLTSLSQLKDLNLHRYNSISIMALRGNSPEETDAKTLTLLLGIQQVLQEHSSSNNEEVNTQLIAEIIDSEDTELVVQAGVRDFLLSNQFVSKILAQVSQEPETMDIYDDLFRAEGSELYLKSASLYFSAEELSQVSFGDCVLAAQSRKELCMGIRIVSENTNQDKMFGICLIPQINTEFKLTGDDKLIVLAEDEQ
ncbi:MAG: hypothetical protein AAGA80_03880 [Cyanobacteria bacterium P01_F01_bin.143]